MMHPRARELQAIHPYGLVCKATHALMDNTMYQDRHGGVGDNVTGSMICPSHISTGVPSYLSRVPLLPQNIYIPRHSPSQSHGTSPNSPGSTQNFTNHLESNFVVASPALISPYNADNHRTLQSYHPYSAIYPGFDVSNTRRRNATRETTNPLKAWLYEHRKNPYPTKGEKIMLAIVTRMTLTQVSTWFANARRRLKKDNRLDDNETDLSDIDIEECSDDVREQETDSGSTTPGIRKHFSTEDSNSSNTNNISRNSSNSSSNSSRSNNNTWNGRNDQVGRIEPSYNDLKKHNTDSDIPHSICQHDVKSYTDFSVTKFRPTAKTVDESDQHYTKLCESNRENNTHTYKQDSLNHGTSLQARDNMTNCHSDSTKHRDDPESIDELDVAGVAGAKEEPDVVHSVRDAAKAKLKIWSVSDIIR